MIENYTEVLYDNETIDSKNILLRRFKKSDAGDMFEYSSDEETLKYLGWDALKTIDEAKISIIDFCWSKQGVFAIELKENKKMIGSIDLTVEPNHEKAILGCILNREYWGKGYMTEALSAVLRLCFEKLELNRVEAEHYVGNEGSGKVMAKCGMEIEGIFKQEIKVKGIFRDVVHYGITRERWLSLNP